MCCSSAKWKREVVPDHKFDFIDVDQFHSRTCGSRLSCVLRFPLFLPYTVELTSTGLALSFTWLWTTFIISIAVYVADIYTLVALLASNRWAGQILQTQASEDNSSNRHLLLVPFKIGKWIFFACIIVSFLLCLWDVRKARAIVKSRDISYAFTNVMAHNWYALRSYNHHCFFSQINDSKKRKDSLAFFVFFTFKGWKRLLLADAPRQVINAITLYSFGASQNWTTDLSAYFTGSFLKVTALSTMLFTVVIFVISAVCLAIAAVIYVPLLCTIQGNLKEYCCHKVDKRISELMKRKNRKRLAREADIARREARGDFSHLKDKSGRIVRAPRPQPTLPTVADHLYADPALDSAKEDAYPPYSAVPTLHRDPSYGGYGGAYAQSNGGYAGSDTDSLGGGKGGFYTHSDSVTSFDAFAGHGQQPGFAAAEPMERAPSYRTMPSQRDFHNPSQRDLLAMPPPRHVDSYRAPPRGGLYERSRMANEDQYYAGSEYELDAASEYGGRYASGDMAGRGAYGQR
ncbi:hypothetical protein BMF94_4713 [Rhodotorula taiwanensis]|uniref:Vacuole protein n=1 Tax=Rhodotorula taiwanensis TaxID=741276 RepID=A0A2S5B610_9BASI|nr:hypothetical protein BMF94_4713 [Rhodotorula taiwanensis]